MLALVLVSGCNGSVLRGVGAPPRAVVADPEGPPALAQAAAVKSQAKLQSGTSMRLAEPATAPDDRPPLEPLPPPEMADTREGAIEQIRAKAAATGKNPPNVFAPPPPPNPRMTPEEEAQTRAELAAAAARNQAVPGVAGQGRETAEARRLRLRAKRHYEDTLKAIEK